MASVPVDIPFLRQFEQGLDPLHPEQSRIPAQVLGYGEISTVFTVAAGDAALAYKRMPLFQSAQEAADYVALYDEYMALFAEIGIEIVPGEMIWFEGNNGRYFVIYLVQKKLPTHTIAHNVIHHLDDEAARPLIAGIFAIFEKVFAFNAQNKGVIEVGFDGQLSNWAVVGFDPESGVLPEPLRLIYLDTSSPLLRRQGIEQLNAEIFLRSAPSFLRPILKALFLEDIVTRYYDLRLVTIDLLANLYKEQQAALVPDLLALANERFGGNGRYAASITLPEIEAYYREDAFIWRVYLGARRFDRWLHRLLRQPYPYILPGHIKR